MNPDAAHLLNKVILLSSTEYCFSVLGLLHPALWLKAMTHFYMGLRARLVLAHCAKSEETTVVIISHKLLKVELYLFTLTCMISHMMSATLAVLAAVKRCLVKPLQNLRWCENLPTEHLYQVNRFKETFSCEDLMRFYRSATGSNLDD